MRVFGDQRNAARSQSPFSNELLGQQLFDDLAVHVGQAVVAALELERQPGVVDAQAVQDRGVQVVDVDAVVRDVVANGRRSRRRSCRA